MDDLTKARLSAEDFIKKYCSNCGSHRCDGLGNMCFEECMYREYLRERKEDIAID